MRRTLLVVLAIVAPVALLAACGDDDGGSDADQEHIDAWTVNLTEDEDGFEVSQDEAECMAEALVERLGTERFEEADVSVEDIEAGAAPGELLGDDEVSEDDARRVLEDWSDCTDLDRLLAESTSAGMGLDGDSVDCLADALEAEGLAADLLVTSFTTADGDPDGESVGRFTVLADDCSMGEDGGGALVESVAASLRADGSLDEAQSLCLAEAVIDTIGRERLVAMSVGAGDFEDAPVDFQQEMAQAILGAAEACGVSPAALGS